MYVGIENLKNNEFSHLHILELYTNPHIYAVMFEMHANVYYMRMK